MKIAVLVLLGLFALRTEAAVIRCEQIEADSDGFTQALDILTNDSDEILAIKNRVRWGAGPGGFEGNLSFAFDAPLSAVCGTYSYLKVIPEEGDQPDTRIAVELRLFSGRAHVRAVYNEGMGGVDEFDLDCSRAF